MKNNIIKFAEHDDRAITLTVTDILDLTKEVEKQRQLRDLDII